MLKKGGKGLLTNLFHMQRGHAAHGHALGGMTKTIRRKYTWYVGHKAAVNNVKRQEKKLGIVVTNENLASTFTRISVSTSEKYYLQSGLETQMSLFEKLNTNHPWKQQLRTFV